MSPGKRLASCLHVPRENRPPTPDRSRRPIDRPVVYELYGLIEEEIKIVKAMCVTSKNLVFFFIPASIGLKLLLPNYPFHYC
jgi:hypothetical protein